MQREIASQRSTPPPWINRRSASRTHPRTHSYVYLIEGILVRLLELVEQLVLVLLFAESRALYVAEERLY